MITGENPAEMRPPKAALERRVKILGMVTKFMVVSMVRSPPKNALLGGALSKEGENQLKDASSFEGAMREVTVIAGSDSEHSDRVSGKAKRD